MLIEGLRHVPVSAEEPEGDDKENHSGSQKVFRRPFFASSLKCWLIKCWRSCRKKTYVADFNEL